MSEDSGGRSLDALLGELARAPDVAPAESLVGKALGRYRIDALLGRGGMGVVYRAHDTTLARDVALKLLPPELVGDGERRARFVREAKLAAAVTHPCTAAVYDVGEHEGTVFLAMELVRGRTLRSVVEENTGGMRVAEVVRIAIDIARGLAKAHEAGIVHRDLKPENVMLDDEGQVKILDFGLAKLRESEGASTTTTEAGRILGTPSYMSPEQAKGKRVDARSDLFSLGVVLYEMLTAKRPFVGESTVEVLIAIDRDPPPPVTAVRKDVPASLVAILDRCLAKDPAARGSNARALADALRAVATDAPRPRASAWLVALPLVAIAAAGALWSARRSDGHAGASAPAPSAALASDRDVLACPPLVATDGDAPAGWLGAAAASLVCRRARWSLGGRTESTLVPAELVGAPRGPTEDAPLDLYEEPNARARAIEAAHARASAWIDGRVDATDDGLRVELVLRGKGDEELARGRGVVADNTLDAIASAMSGLGLRERPLAPEIARWTGIADASLARAAFDCELAMGQYLRDSPCVALEPRAAELGDVWTQLGAERARRFGVPGPRDAPAIDRSSPERLLLSSGARNAVSSDVGVDVADELRAAAEREPPGYGRAQLRLADAAVRYSAGHVAEIREPLLALVQERPRDEWAWPLLGAASFGLPGYLTVVKTYAYWLPDFADPWSSIGYSMPLDDPKRVAVLARAVKLAPDVALYSTNLAQALLIARRPTAIRSVASRLMPRGPRNRLTAEGILVGADAGTARFGAALDRARTIVETAPVMGRIEDGLDTWIMSAIEMERLVRKTTTLADASAERFVLADPPRLVPGHFAPVFASAVCMAAQPAIAKRCLARVRRLVDDGFFREGMIAATKPLLEGFERRIAGDDAGAARALRPILEGSTAFLSSPVVETFDRAGDAETAERADRRVLFKSWNGASPAYVRAARRAAKRGDVARARELAQTVVDAWGAADVEVDVVQEMRALLAKLPK